MTGWGKLGRERAPAHTAGLCTEAASTVQRINRDSSGQPGPHSQRENGGYDTNNDLNIKYTLYNELTLIFCCSGFFQYINIMELGGATRGKRDPSRRRKDWIQSRCDRRMCCAEASDTPAAARAGSISTLLESEIYTSVQGDICDITIIQSDPQLWSGNCKIPFFMN